MMARHNVVIVINAFLVLKNCVDSAYDCWLSNMVLCVCVYEQVSVACLASFSLHFVHSSNHRAHSFCFDIQYMYCKLVTLTQTIILSCGLCNGICLTDYWWCFHPFVYFGCSWKLFSFYSVRRIPLFLLLFVYFEHCPFLRYFRVICSQFSYTSDKFKHIVKTVNKRHENGYFFFLVFLIWFVDLFCS